MGKNSTQFLAQFVAHRETKMFVFHIDVLPYVTNDLRTDNRCM